MFSHTFFIKSEVIHGILVNERWYYVDELPENTQPINCNVNRAEKCIYNDKLSNQ